MQLERCYGRWIGAVLGGGEQSLAGAREQSQVEGGLWLRGVIAGGEERTLVDPGGGEQSQVEGSDRWCKGAVSGGGERSTQWSPLNRCDKAKAGHSRCRVFFFRTSDFQVEWHSSDLPQCMVSLHQREVSAV